MGRNTSIKTPRSYAAAISPPLVVDREWAGIGECIRDMFTEMIMRVSSDALPAMLRPESWSHYVGMA